MNTRTWRVAAMATLGMLCTGTIVAQSPAASEWTFLGAAEPDVTSLAVSPWDPQLMLARVNLQSPLPVVHTVWLSRDGGTNWRPLPDAGIWTGGQLAFTSDGQGLVADSGVVHLVQPDGLWALPWVPGNAPAMLFGDVAVGAGDRVFASAAQSGGGSYEWGVYALDLAGEQLHPRHPPLPTGHDTIKLLAADPVNAGVVVALSDSWENPWPQDTRLWVSTDAGQGWSARTDTMPSRDLTALHFTDDGWLATFAPDNMGGSSGLYRSSDHGQSWVALTQDFPDHPTDAAQDPANPQRLLVTGYDGLHLSEDGGASWQYSVADTAGRWLSGVQFAPGGGVLVTDVAGGLFTAAASPLVLERLGPQLGAMSTGSLSINPGDAGDVAAIGQGLYKRLATSTDGGVSWGYDPAWPITDGQQVLHGPDGRLYVAGRSGSDYLMVRGSGGGWSALMPGVASLSEMHSLAFGASAQHLLVAARMWTGSGYQNQLLRSVDGGGSWSVAHAAPAPSRPVSKVFNTSGPAGDRFLALLADTVNHDAVLLMGTDGGQSWGPAGANLPAGLRHVEVCTAGAGAGTPRAYLSALENSQPQLYRSDDDGLSWQRTGWVPGWPDLPISRVTALWCDPDQPDVVVLGGFEGTVLRSTDAGNSFALLGDDLGGHTYRVTALAASPAGLLYASTREGAWAVELPDDAPPAPRNLVVRITGAHARPRMMLTWEGGEDPIMVRRNGALLAVVANTGSFQDRPSPRDLPASYQVCNGDGSHCTASTAAVR